MQVSGDGYEKLNDAIEKASVEEKHMTSKADIVAYYKATYPGKGTGGWRDMIQRDMSLTTGTKYNSIRRQFDPSRINNAPVKGSANAQGFENLGKQLPKQEYPKDTRGKKARVSWAGDLQTYDEKRPRMGKSYTGTLSPYEANQMRKGSFDPVFASFGFPPGIITEIDVSSVNVEFL